MSQTDRKGLSPKYVIHKSGYRAVKSPLSQKKKKPSYPDQFIKLNTDLAHRKYDFTNEINISIEPTLSAEYCYLMYEKVKKESAEELQEYFRFYFSRHPMKINKYVQSKKPMTTKRVVLELK